MIFKLLGFTIASALAVHNARAEFQIVTTLPELAWGIRKVLDEAKRHGIDLKDVTVTHLLKGTEDPHAVDAQPGFVLKASNASMLCSIGLELEVGWLPKIVERASNARLQPGSPGDCVASRYVQVLERPTGAVDRSMGDVHAAGNPHFWMSPLAMADAIRAMAESLVLAYGPAQIPSEPWAKSVDAVLKDLRTRHAALKSKIPPGLVAIEFHREFAYFFQAYGIQSLGSLEEKPGLPPSAARIAAVAQLAKSKGARFLITTPAHPRATAEQFNSLSNIPVVTVPAMLKTSQDYFELQDQLIQSLTSHAPHKL